MGQDTTRSRSGQGHTLAGAVTLVTQVSGHGPQARCGMYRDGGQFGCGRVILAALCGDTEENKECGRTAYL
jgi:hypothetical protein